MFKRIHLFFQFWQIRKINSNAIHDLSRRQNKKKGPRQKHKAAKAASDVCDCFSLFRCWRLWILEHHRNNESKIRFLQLLGNKSTLKPGRMISSWRSVDFNLFPHFMLLSLSCHFGAKFDKWYSRDLVFCAVKFSYALILYLGRSFSETCDKETWLKGWNAGFIHTFKILEAGLV